MEPTTKRTYTLKETAAELGVTVHWLRNQVSRGLVPHGRWKKVQGTFFTENHIHAIINARERVSVERLEPEQARASRQQELQTRQRARSLASLRSTRASA